MYTVLGTYSNIYPESGQHRLACLVAFRNLVLKVRHRTVPTISWPLTAVSLKKNKKNTRMLVCASPFFIYLSSSSNWFLVSYMVVIYLFARDCSRIHIGTRLVHCKNAQIMATKTRYYISLINKIRKWQKLVFKLSVSLSSVFEIIYPGQKLALWDLLFIYPWVCFVASNCHTGLRPSYYSTPYQCCLLKLETMSSLA